MLLKTSVNRMLAVYLFIRLHRNQLGQAQRDKRWDVHRIRPLHHLASCGASPPRLRVQSCLAPCMLVLNEEEEEDLLRS